MAKRTAIHPRRRWLQGCLIAVAVLFAALGTGIIFTPSALAATTDTLSPKDQSTITRIEQYLNNVTTLKARFVQMTSLGTVSEGDFIISRPGKMRIDYDPPSTIRIISTGNFLVYIDTELEQTTYLPLWSTPAGVLVDDNIRLNGEKLKVTHVGYGKQTVEVSLVQRDKPDAGEITLVFSDNPLQLRRWIVIDPQGVTTNFALLDMRAGVKVDPGLFKAPPPKQPDNDR